LDFEIFESPSLCFQLPAQPRQRPGLRPSALGLLE